MCQIFSSTVPMRKKLKNFPNFFSNFFEVYGKSHSAEKCKRGPLEVFEHPFFCKIEKNEGGLFGDIKKLAKSAD